MTGPPAAAAAAAGLLTHLAAKESERRALAGEVLHLYREVHLIEHLSEQLAALLDLSAVGQSALDQARRLIAASHGGILVREEPGGPLRSVASFGASGDGQAAPLPPSSRFAASIVERGIAEIVNDCAADPRALEAERSLRSLICAPLRAKQRTVGVIALANTRGTPYSTADLKLLNTIALQTAAAIENSLLCSEMVVAARDRAQLAALQKELDTARTIQHLLVPRTFPPFPDRRDFDIHAQMTSARAVGGDFFDFFLHGRGPSGRGDWRRFGQRHPGGSLHGGYTHPDQDHGSSGHAPRGLPAGGESGPGSRKCRRFVRHLLLRHLEHTHRRALLL